MSSSFALLLFFLIGMLLAKHMKTTAQHTGSLCCFSSLCFCKRSILSHTLHTGVGYLQSSPIHFNGLHLSGAVPTKSNSCHGNEAKHQSSSMFTPQPLSLPLKLEHFGRGVCMKVRWVCFKQSFCPITRR